MIQESVIKNIKTVKQLSKVLAIDSKIFEKYLKTKDNLVNFCILPKRTGGFRIIYIVNPKEQSFILILRNIKDILDDIYSSYVPDSVNGFVKGRSVLTNANLHTNKKFVLNIDIRNFFDNIKEDDIVKSLKKIGFKNNIAKILSNIVCFKGRLVTGFHTSPIISNIICLDLDKELEDYAKDNNLTYSRYVDDITFSTNKAEPDLLSIRKIIAKYGFQLNIKKTRLYKRGGPQYVTGLTVCDYKPRIPKRIKKNLRLEFYYMKKYGIGRHFTNRMLLTIKKLEKNDISSTNFNWLINKEYSIVGILNYINSIEPNISKKYFSLYETMID